MDHCIVNRYIVATYAWLPPLLWLFCDTCRDRWSIIIISWTEWVEYYSFIFLSPYHPTWVLETSYSCRILSIYVLFIIIMTMIIITIHHYIIITTIRITIIPIPIPVYHYLMYHIKSHIPLLIFTQQRPYQYLLLISDRGWCPSILRLPSTYTLLDGYLQW